ncbi:MAG TPA: hypothetical protein VLV18_10820 [Terriglobales bacterium]|nr:hypothetical protein [Terriglobales bacterium]
MLNRDGVIKTPWMDFYGNTIVNRSSWLWLFNAWDSFNFGQIAVGGYSHPNYAYLPAYPVLIHLVGLGVGDYWFGAFLVTQVFALASIIMFQLLAEKYMEPREALFATILMATFPYVAVFTTLGYSEALFLFSSVSAWYLYKKNRIGPSFLLSGLASITRIYGIAIVLPIVTDIVRSKQYRRLVYVAIPLVFIGAWLLYCNIATGDPLASWTDEGYWGIWSNGQSGIRYGLIQSILIPGLKGNVICCAGGNAFDSAILIAVAFVAYLILKTWKVDLLLWTYAASVFTVLLFAAPLISLVRYVVFIFPIWLSVKVRNPVIVGICVAFFIPVFLVVWLYALLRNFIG